MADVREWLGYVALQKRGGSVSGGLAIGDVRYIPVAMALPTNTKNNRYPRMSNNTAETSQRQQGKRTPMVPTMSSCIKPYDTTAGAGATVNGWSDAALLKSLIELDATGNTDNFSIVIANDTSTRIWDYARCRSLSMSCANMQEGTIMVAMGFAARYGENECPYGTTLADGEVIGAAPVVSSPAATVNAGTFLDPTAWDTYSGTTITTGQTFTADDVEAFDLTTLREQFFRGFADRSRFNKRVASGTRSGALTLTQSAGASVVVADTGTIRIRVSTDKAIGTGRFYMDVKVSQDGDVEVKNDDFGRLVSTYTLADLSTGASPISFVAF